jgi:hypothetical protein
MVTCGSTAEGEDMEYGLAVFGCVGMGVFLNEFMHVFKRDAGDWAMCCVILEVLHAQASLRLTVSGRTHIVGVWHICLPE